MNRANTPGAAWGPVANHGNYRSSAGGGGSWQLGGGKGFPLDGGGKMRVTAAGLPDSSARGNPLKRSFNRKKLFLPNLLRLGFSALGAKVRFEGTFRACVFVSRFRPPRRAIACAGAIRSVTHLVLAPAGRPRQSTHLEPRIFAVFCG